MFESVVFAGLRTLVIIRFQVCTVFLTEPAWCFRQHVVGDNAPLLNRLSVATIQPTVALRLAAHGSMQGVNQIDVMQTRILDLKSRHCSTLPVS